MKVRVPGPAEAGHVRGPAKAGHYVLLIVLLAGSALSAGQATPRSPAPRQAPPTPTFRVQVESIEVGVRVTDAQGLFVRDLTANDFEIFEDGKPQTISTFSLVDIPISGPTPTTAAERGGGQAVREPAEPDVATNAHPFDGRLYIMVLDDLHVLPSRTAYVRRAARRFIDDHLGANDLMAVVHTRARAEYSQEFTSNKRLLRAAADQFIGHADPTQTVAMYQRYVSSGRVEDPFADSRADDSLTSLRQLEAIAEWFGTYVRGRKKSILFVSEGFTVGFTGAQTGLSERAREVIRSASRANVNIYAIDPRGLTVLGDDNIELNGLKQGDNAEGVTFRGITQAGLQDLQRVQTESLRGLAQETDGFAVVNTNGFAGAFDRIVQENSSYYVLAYSPPNPKRDGKFHEVKVRSKRPGLTVQARAGYTAPRSTPRAPESRFANALSPEARTALGNPLQTTGLSLQVFAAPFRGTQANASVLVGAEVRGKDLRLTPGSRLQISYFAADAKGDVRSGKTDAFTLDLDANTKAAIEASSVRAMTRLDLAPGRYQLRVIADRLDAGGVGSVYYDIDVPDFSKAPLAMSGLVLTSMPAALQPNLVLDDTLAAVLPGAPVAARTFPLWGAFALFAEIYDNRISQPHRLDITTTITSETGAVVFTSDETKASSEIQGRNGAYGYLTNVSLHELTAGSYVVTVEARSSVGDDVVVSRQVPFTILPDSGVTPPR